MALSPEQIEVLVASLLAVNQYPLERVWDQMPALREAGLTNAKHVANADIRDVVVNLTEAGHDRGMLAGMMAERLQNLMRAIEGGVLDAVPPAVARRDREAAVVALCRVKGIGPRVAETAWQQLSQGAG